MAHYDALKEAPPETGEEAAGGSPAEQWAPPPLEQTDEESGEEGEVVRKVRRVTISMKEEGGGGLPQDQTVSPERVERPYRREIQKWLRERGIWLVGSSLRGHRAGGMGVGTGRRGGTSG